MDYEKEYKSLVAKVKKAHQFAQTDSTKSVLEDILPQLRESEDERIRKELVALFLEVRNREGDEGYWHDLKVADILAYLEKQKEHNGEDEECTDFTIYHPLKNGKGKYECIPYSFHGSLTSFSEDKDLIDFLRTCFYTKEECEEWIEKQKEQKPVVTHGETYHVDTLGTQQVIAGKMQQKPAWSEEDEKKIRFLSRLIEFQVKDGEYCFGEGSCAISKQEAIEMLQSIRPQPKQEVTDEEIEEMVTKRSRSSGTTKSEMAFYRNGIKDAIKRFGLRPSWKPSKQQMEALHEAVIRSCSHHYGVELSNLEIDLLKLK